MHHRAYPLVPKFNVFVLGQRVQLGFRNPQILPDLLRFVGSAVGLGARQSQRRQFEKIVVFDELGEFRRAASEHVELAAELNGFLGET